jgi:hypothetical protein
MGTHNRPKFYVVGACALAAFALHAGNARAQGSNCLLDIGAVVVNGNVQIATSCELTGTEVKGNVILFAGGSLIARNVHIKGSVQGSRADFVDMERSRVDGNLRLEELVGDVSTIILTDIRGDVLLVGNRSRLEILNNEIRKSLQATGNAGGLLISGNLIDRNLECADNTPTPFGVGNRVDGDRKGQCEQLQAEAPPPQPPSQPPETPSQPPPPTATPSPPSTPEPGGPALPPTGTVEPDEDDGGTGAIGWPAASAGILSCWTRCCLGWSRCSRPSVCTLSARY